MIVADKREKLRQALTRLINGRMTNDQFDSLYYNRWKESEDRGVAVVAEFGYGLYSDLNTYRLKGRHAISAETRAIAERCLLFLRTENEYSWPPFPGLDWRRYYLGNASWGCFPGGMAFLLISVLMFFESNPLGLFLLAFIPGCLILGLGFILSRWYCGYVSPRWQAFWAAGDKEAWPFLRLQELEQARNNFNSPDTPPVPLLPHW